MRAEQLACFGVPVWRSVLDPNHPGARAAALSGWDLTPYRAVAENPDAVRRISGASAGAHNSACVSEISMRPKSERGVLAPCSRQRSTVMRYGYGLGGVVIVVLLVLFLMGRL
jgi:hypothetical protein